MKKLGILLLSFVSTLAFGADVKISNLPSAAAQTGAELLPEVQGGVTVQTTTGAAANAGTLTGDGTKSAGSTALSITKLNGTTPGGSCTNQAVTSLTSSAVPSCSTVTASFVDSSIAQTGGDINTANQIVATHLSSALPATQGGTSFSSYTTGDLAYASSSTTLARLADVAVGNVLISGGVGTAFSWGKVALGSMVSGNLGVANLNSGTGAGSTTYWRGDGTWATVGGVSSVGLTVPATSIFGTSGSPVTSTGNLGLTTTGISGALLYFSSTSQVASSGLMAAHGVVLGEGAGAAPVTVTGSAAGQILTWNASGDPSFSAGVTINGLPSATAVASTDLLMIYSQADTQVEQATVAQVAPAVDKQLFIANGTWTKPAGAKMVHILLIGAGGSGAGGARLASLGAASGGGGGGAGCRVDRWLEASDLGATVAITTAAGPSGGAGSTTNGSNGSDGAQGTTTTFGSWSAFAGGGGSQGAAAATNSGGGGGAGSQSSGGTASGATGGTAGSTGGAGGGAGAAGNNGGTVDCGGSGGGDTQAAAGNGGGLAFNGPGGGGAGGGISGAAAFAGGSGGRTAGYYSTITGGANTGANGTSPTSLGNQPGAGGAGGGANTTGAGGNGGTPANYGAGGGGGGAGVGGNGGTGGKGGDGLAEITSYF